MTRYLMDTNHASLLFRRIPEVVASFDAHTADQLFLCMPVVGELWYMVYNSQRPDQNVLDMAVFLDRFSILDFTRDAAVQFGLIKTDLRRRGKPIPGIDVQIAAIAQSENLALLTDDAHFNSIQGLVLENWLRS